MKEVTKIQEVDVLRGLAERDTGLLEVIDGLRAARLGRIASDKQAKRLRMPYVNTEPLNEGGWK